MLALLLALSLGAASRAWAAHLGCDSLCSHQGVDLSCRVRIRWSMEHTTFRDEPNPCGLARDHVLELCPSCAACSPESLGDECREAILRRVRNGSANGSQGAAAGALQKSSGDGSAGNASAGNISSQGIGVLQNSSANDSAGNASAGNLSSANSSGHPANASEGKSAGRRHGKNTRSSSSTSNATSTTTSTNRTSTTSTNRTSTTNSTSTTTTTTITTSETFCCKVYGCVLFKPFNECQCNPECVKFGSCCDDYKDVCEKEENHHVDEAQEKSRAAKKEMELGQALGNALNEALGMEVPEETPHGAKTATGAGVSSPQTSWSDEVLEDGREAVHASMEVPEETPHGAKTATGAGASSPQTSWSDEVLEDGREAVQAMRGLEVLEDVRPGYHGKGAHEVEQPARPHGKQPDLSGMSAVPRGAPGLLQGATARLGATHASLALALGLLVSSAVVVARRGCRQWTPVATSQLSAVLPLAPPEE